MSYRGLISPGNRKHNFGSELTYRQHFIPAGIGSKLASSDAIVDDAHELA